MADDEFFEVDLGNLKIREMEEIEDLLGASFSEVFAADKGVSAKALRALAFVSKKRANPDFTWEQAGDLVIRMAEPEPDPTEAAGS